MMAALFLRQVATWRSRQLYERLILPPRNHFAHGAFHSSTLSHGLNQWSSRATSAQKPSGSAAARAQILSYSSLLWMWAFLLNSAGGGKERVSVRTESIFVPACSLVDIKIASDESWE